MPARLPMGLSVCPIPKHFYFMIISFLRHPIAIYLMKQIFLISQRIFKFNKSYFSYRGFDFGVMRIISLLGGTNNDTNNKHQITQGLNSWFHSCSGNFSNYWAIIIFTDHFSFYLLFVYFGAIPKIHTVFRTYSRLFIQESPMADSRDYHMRCILCWNMGDAWVKFQEYKKLKSGVLHIALEAYFIALSKLP